MMDSQFLNLMLWQAIQIAILVTVTKLLLKTSGRTRPFLSHVLWAVVLIKCVTPPIWSSPFGVFTQMANHVELSSLRSNVTSQDALTARASERPWEAVETNPQDSTLYARIHVDPLETASLAEPIEVGASTRFQHGRPESNDSTERIVGVPLLVVWLGGAIFAAGFLFVRLIAFFYRLQSLPIRQCPELDQLTLRLSKRLRIRKSVRVHIVDGNIGPAVLGWFRPRVLLPEVIVNDTQPNSLRLLITHELMHIRRGDLWWAGLQEIARCVWWFHPWVRHAAKSMECETEKCCDQQTMTAMKCLPSDYAKCLVEVLEKKHQLRAAPTFPGVRAIDITTERLERIMTTDVKRKTRNQVWVWPCLLIACAVILPGAGMVSAQTDQTESTQTEGKATSTTESSQAKRSSDRKDPSPGSEIATSGDGETGLITHGRLARTGRFIFGSAVNSDAGLEGQVITEDSPTPEQSAKQPKVLPNPVPNERIATRIVTKTPVLRTYSIQGVLKRLRETGVDRETAETQFLNMLPKIPDNNLQVDLQVFSEGDGEEDGSNTPKRRGAVIQDERLFLMAPEHIHQEVTDLIRRSERFGFEQVLIEASLVLVPTDQWESLGVEWRPIVKAEHDSDSVSDVAPAAPALPRLPTLTAPIASVRLPQLPTANLRDTTTQNTGPKPDPSNASESNTQESNTVDQSSGDIDQVAVQSPASVRQLSAHTSIQRFNQMEIAVLDHNPTERVVRSVKGIQVLSVPKVITVNGRSAAIEVGAKQKLISGYQSTADGKGMEPLHE
ncbi:MAG: M56 family metallopeptidase, partial [Planctomycetota bacterium]